MSRKPRGLRNGRPSAGADRARAERRDVWSMRKTGTSIVDIAEHYGCDRSTISRILTEPPTPRSGRPGTGASRDPVQLRAMPTVAEAIRAYEAEGSSLRAARTLGVSQMAVLNRLHAAGVQLPPSGPPGVADGGSVGARVETLVRSGSTITRAAQTVGVKRTTANRWMVARGVVSPLAKTGRRLRRRDVMELCRAYEDGASREEVGARFGLSSNSVRLLLEKEGVPVRGVGEWRAARESAPPAVGVAERRASVPQKPAPHHQSELREALPSFPKQVPGGHRMTMYRQGDVLIRRITTPIPKGLNAVPRDAGRVVLAYGEVTGHAHAITDPAVGLYAADINDLTRSFLVIEGERAADLRHEEHATIALPPGTYEVRRQREYAPEAPIWVTD